MPLGGMGCGSIGGLGGGSAPSYANVGSSGGTPDLFPSPFPLTLPGGLPQPASPGPAVPPERQSEARLGLWAFG